MHLHLLFFFLTAVLSTTPTDSVAEAVAAGVTAFENGAFEESARILLSRLEVAADDHAASYELARARLAQARFQGALDAVDRAIALAPRESRYHRLRGEALGRLAQEASIFKRLGLAKRGLAAFEQAVALDPSNVQARDSLMEYYYRAPGFAGGSLRKARAQANAIGAIAPAKGRQAHGRIHRHRQEVALEHYRAAVAEDPADRDIRYDFVTYLIELERWDEARVSLNMMLSDPANHDDDYRALHETGRIAALAGSDLEHGAAALVRYLGRLPRFGHPSHASAQYYLGRIRARQGNDDAARRAFEAALALDPEHPGAKKALRGVR